MEAVAPITNQSLSVICCHQALIPHIKNKRSQLYYLKFSFKLGKVYWLQSIRLSAGGKKNHLQVPGAARHCTNDTHLWPHMN